MAYPEGPRSTSSLLFLLVVLLYLCAGSPIIAQESITQVKIETDDAAAVAQQLIDAGYDVVEGSVTDGTFEIWATDLELATLETAGYEPRVVSTGQPLHETQGERAATAAAPPAGYPDLTEVLNQMTAAADNYSGICQLVDLTTTYNVPATFEGRHIFAVKISDNVSQDEDEPTALIVSAHHPNEVVTTIVALHAMEQFTTLYGTDPTITDLVNENEIWIAPVWNVDGYAYGGWRKNRHVFEGGIGVELNRNYPFGWSSQCAGSTDPASGGYKGPSPGSESETQTMIALSNDRRFSKVLDFHQAGSEVLRGYHCLNHPFQTFLIEQAIELADAFGFFGDTRPPSAEGEHYEWQFAMMGAQANLVELLVSGSPDIMVAQQEAADRFPGILFSLQRPVPLSGHVTDAVTGEPVVATLRYLEINFENGETNASGARFGGYHVFLPPGEVTLEFSALGYETQHHVVDIDPQTEQTLEVQLQPTALVVELIEGPSGLIEIGETPEVVVAITSGTENLVPGSETLYHRYDDGAFLNTPLTPAGADQYSATLPLVEHCGDEHEYYITAQGDGGTQAILPSDAPAFVFDFDVGEPLITVHSDDAWQYFKGAQEPSPGDLTAWTGIGFDDSSWEEGAGTFGYGDDCVPFGTVLDDMQNGYRSLYLRKSFSLGDPTIVIEMTLTADYDDSFVAYINGTEVARNNILGNPPPFDGLASSDHECSGSPVTANPPEDYPIHRSVDLASLLVAGDNVLAIQGHNLTDTSSDFTLDMTLSSVVCGCNDGADCADGDLCNGIETCADDICVPGTPIDCAPLLCDPADGSCVNCLNDADCDDGDACNGAEVCDGGACSAGPPLDCDDGVACTDDSCDPLSGCSNVDNCPFSQLCNPGTGLCEETPIEPLPVIEGSEWRFFKGTQEPSSGELTAWTQLTFDDTSWQTGSSGFGYDVDCSHGTVLDDMQGGYSSLYARRLFLVDDPSLVEELTLTIDYDDSFVAYVNGIEVARNNVLGNPPPYNTPAQVDHECSGSSGAANPPDSFDLHLGFNPAVLLQPGANVLAIQGHNLTQDSSDFTLTPTLESVEAEPCVDPEECADGDLCTVDDCVDGGCYNPPIACPPGEACNPSSGECELQITVSFQQGLSGYSGTVDTFIQEEASAADNDNSALEALNWDSDDPVDSGFSAMTLIRFENVFGDNPNQVPAGALVLSATLSYTVGGDSNAPGDYGEFHEMLVLWAETVSWNGLGGTPGATPGEDYEPEIAATLPGGPAGTHDADVTSSLQAWSDNPSANRGWIVVPTNTNGTDVRSSEYLSNPTVRPQLTVTYTPQVECDTDADCDDGDACNGAETCDPATGCEAGTPPDCDDGNACTDDSCEPAAGCEHAPISCDDADACTTDSCDPAVGCEYEPVTCDDGDACNGAETCDPATGCEAGTPPDCDDGNACTDDSCEPAAGCEHAPISCDDADACTTDSCDPAVGCAYEPVTCDDGDACNGAETCDPATGCEAGTPPDCDDGNACTDDSCEPATGCEHAPISCDDADACTTDSCDPAVGCEYEPVTCDDGDACNGAETCDPATGCEAGTPPDCDDGNACTNDSCEPATGCVHAPISCDDADACTTDSCVPAVGCAYEPVTCDDGDACNGAETCDPATGCEAGTPLNCDDSDACTTDTCDPATGCVYEPVVCDDGDACTVDACDPGTGCVNTPIICDDGVFCNGTEVCDAGECVDGLPPGCEDGDACTEDYCDPILDACTNVAPPVPAEVRNLQLDRSSPDSTIVILAWDGDPDATSYNVYRGTRADLVDLACFLSHLSGLSVSDDGALPASGTAMFYLTTAATCSGESSLGAGRPNPDPCP